jgi:hypothetical protein
MSKAELADALVAIDWTRGARTTARSGDMSE